MKKNFTLFLSVILLLTGSITSSQAGTNNTLSIDGSNDYLTRVNNAAFNFAGSNSKHNYLFSAAPLLAPVISCPANINTTNTTGLCSKVVTYTATATGSPAPTFTYTFLGATVGSGSGTGSGQSFNIGATTVTVTATNSTGTATCSFVVTVVDNEKPVITCQPNMTVNVTPGRCDAVVAVTSPSVTDNCSQLLSGNALNFDGVNDIALVAASSVINQVNQNARTVEVYFKVNDKNISSQKQVIWEEGAQSNGLNIYVYNGELYMGIYSSTQNWIPMGNWIHTPNIQSGQWHNAVLVFDGNAAVATDRLKGYLDGQLFGSSSTGGTILNAHTGANAVGALSNAGVFHDGVDNSTTSSFFGGDIDEIRLWTVARTAAQLAATNTTKLLGTETGLVVYYDFDQGTACGNNSAITILQDRTSTGLNGTLQGFNLGGATCISNFTNGSPAITSDLSLTNSKTGTSDASGTYPVGVTTLTWTAKDLTGNTSTCTQTVTVVNNNAATITPSGPTTFCSGGSVTLTASAGSSYLWSNGATTQAISVSTSGTFTVTVSYAGGNCALTSAPTTITVNPNPVANITANGPTTFCAGGSVALTVSSGNALTFNGTNRVTVTNTPTLPVGNSAYTIEAWVKPKTISGVNGIIGWGNWGSVNQTNAIRFNGPTTLINYWWTNDLYVTIPNVLDGKWHHIAATFNGTTRSLYMDGVLLGSDTPSGHNIPSGTPMYIAETNPTSNEYFDGAIDEVRIWNVGKTQLQINATMNTTVPVNSAGLVAYYKLDEGSGVATADATNNGNTGTLTGSPVWNVPSTSQFAGNFQSISWSPGGVTTSSITVTTSGTYTATVTNASGCTTVSTPTVVTVNPLPTVTASSNSPLNLNGTLNLTATGANSYSWTGPNSFTATGATPSITSVSLANVGVYTVVGTNTTTGCTNTATTNVTIAATGLTLDGVNDYVSVPDNNSLDFGSGNFTIETWVNKRALSNNWANEFVVGKWNNGASAGTNEWDLATGSTATNNIPTFLMEVGTSGYVCTGTTSLQLNTWYHLAVVRNGTSLKLYVNGLLEGSITIPANAAINNTGLNMTIGAFGLNGHPSFFANMSIDELRLWNRALCQAEIQNNKDCELNPAGQSGLVALYHFNQGLAGGSNSDITTLTDATVNGLNGTLNNFALSGNTSNWTLGNASGNCTTFVPATTPISGITTVCLGTSSTLTNTSTGGVWSSSNTAVATVNSNGVVSSLSAGTTVISYTNDCGGVSTVTFTVNALPSATIAGTASVCQNGSSPIITFSGSNATSPYTFTYTINGGAQQTVTSVGNTATVSVPSGTPGTFTYALVSVKDASATLCTNTATGSAVVTVNALPSASIAGTTSVCQNGTSPNITFTGSNGTSPYTFTYTINGGSQQTVVSSGNTAFVSVPTGTAGTFTYALVSVKDASATLCTNTATGSAVVTVNALPSATIAGTASVCQNAATSITFTGTNGISPYTFTYTINGGAPQTIVSAGNTANLPVSTATAGTFTYALVSVKDASSTLCTNTATGSAVVTVNALPTPVISASGPTTFCANGSVNLSVQGGGPGNALTFSSSKYVDIPHNALLNVGTSTDFTYEAWVKLAGSQGNFAGVVIKGTGGPFSQLVIVNNHIASEIYNNSLVSAQGTTNLADNAWHHLAMVVSRASNTCKLYVDGGLEATVTNAIISTNLDNPQSMLIGVERTKNIYFNGSIDEVRVWNTARTPAQLQSAKGTSIPANSTGLVAYYKLDEGSGTTTADATANANSGTLVGSPVWLVPSTAPISGFTNFNWSNSATTSSINPASSGNYTVTVTDLFGCVNTSSPTTVTINPLPSATVNGTTTVCQNAAQPVITFTGSNATSPYTFTYTINGVVQTPVTSVSNTATVSVPTGTAGTFTYALVSVKDASNTTCTNTATGSAVITVNALPVATITPSGSTSFCFGGSVNLTASAGTTYLWSNGATTPSINNVTASGNYTVTVTSNGCATTSAPIAVTVTGSANSSSFITVASDTDIKNDGLLVVANNLGSGAVPVSINGVCFGNSQANLTNFVPSVANFCAECATGSNLDKLLDYLVFQPDLNESTLTLNGLTPCHRYRIQLFFSNDINNTGADIKVQVNGQNYTFSNWIPAAKNLIVEFNASSTSTVVRFLAGNSLRSVLNAYALHDLDMPAGPLCNAAPVANAGADINGSTNNGCLGNVTLNAAASTDPDNNISAYRWKEGSTTLGTGVSINFNFAVGTHNVTLEVEDAFGLISTDNLVVTISDNVPPVINCPVNITTTATSAAGAVVTYTAPVGTDNCSATTTRIAGPASGSTFPIGTTTVTYQVTDAAGNSVQCSFTVTVSGLAPQISCPANITVNATAGQCGANVPFGASETTGIPASTISYSIAPSSFFAVGTTTVTATATNAVGTSTCSFTVTVVDVTSPTITCPANIAVSTAANKCAATISISNATATDNCSVATITGTRSDGLALTADYPKGTTTIVWTAKDVAGNTSTCSQTVTVTDNIAPTVITKNITVNLDASGTASITASQVDNGSTDNCGVASVSVSPTTFNCSNVSNTIPNAGNALLFNGTGSIDVAHQTSIAPLNEWTIETWVKLSVLNTQHSLIEKYSCNGNEYGYLLRVTSGNQIMGGALTGCGFNGTVTGSTVLAANTWYHVAATFNKAAGTVKIYVNGVLDGSIANVTIPTTASSLPLRIGSRGNDAATKLQGWLDDVRIWDVERSAAQILATKATKLAGTETGLQAYYSFDEALASTNVTDGATLTVANNATFATGVSRVASSAPIVSNGTQVTLTVTDVNGNSATGNAIVTVVDNIAPVFTACPANQTLFATSTAGAIATYTTPTATDNCSAVVTRTTGLASGATFPIGTTTVTHTATDPSGNSVTCTFTVTVSGLAPQIVCPSNITVNAITGQCGANVPFTATESTAIPASVISYNENNITVTPGSFFSVGSHTITATATNAVGSSSCNFTITVVDNQPPVLVGVPADVTIECDAVPAAPVVTATDNCNTSVPTFTETRTNGTCTSNYILTRTWSTKDASGNTTTKSQLITVQDTKAPILSAAPADVTVNCDAIPAAAILTATDNCDATPVVSFAETSTQSGDLSNVAHYNYTITRVWTATDACRNASSKTQIITVQDVTKPIITCPAPVTVNCQDDHTSANTGVATATDNCADASNIVISQTETSTYSADVSNINHYSFTITRTWRATDVAGNYSECDQIITVQDIAKPVITCPAPITVNCQDDHTSSATGVATATDNCADAANITITQTEVSTQVADINSAAHYNYTITRTWRATDVAGNYNECDQIITVQDITKPVIITTPNNIATNNDEGVCGAMINFAAAATDNCGPVTITYSKDPGTVFPVGITEVTVTATDASGNVLTSTFTVTVTDNEKPTIVTVNKTQTNDTDDCGAIVSVPVPVTGDNCEVATVVNDYNNTSDASGHYPVGTTTINWTVTDIHGNVNTTTQLVIVTDNQAPVITAPADVTVNADNGTCAATNVNLGTPITGDNCSIASVTNDATEPFSVGTTVVTWTVTDVNGNVSTATQNVIVIDNQPPIITAPADITVSADAGTCSYDLNLAAGVAAPKAGPQASSKSGKGVEKHKSKVKKPGGIKTPGIIINDPTDGFLGTPDTGDNCAVASLSNDAPIVFPVGSTVVIWTITDIHGNSSTATQKVVVTDDEDPTIISAGDQTQTADAGDCGAIVTVVAPTTNDNCGVSSVVNDYNGTSDASGHYPVGTTVVTWMVTDIHGNTNTTSQSITVTDDEKPTILSAGDQTQTADAGDCGALVTVVAPSTNDNCGVSSVTNSYNGTSDASGHYPVGTTVVTWTVIDIHGNTNTTTQTITVTDNENPTIISAGNQTQTADAGDCGALVTVVAPSTNDNCGVSSVTNNYNGTSDASGHYPVGTTVITWTVIDTHGNTNTTTQSIIVTDDEKPTIVTVNKTQNNDAGDCGAVVSVPVPVTGDNCQVATLVNDYNNSSDASGHYPVGTTIINWTVTDIHGNSNTATQTVTVIDNEKPKVKAPGAYSVPNDPGKCGATIPSIGTPFTSDNCGVFKISNDHPSTFYPVGTTIVTWTVTDIHGNVTDTAKQRIRVIDNELPKIGVNNISVNSDLNVCGATITPAAPVTSDNCDVATVVSDHPSTFYPVGTTLVTWTVTDVHGWQSSAVQTIIVTDHQAPTVITKNITVNLDGTGKVNITAIDVDNGSNDACGIKTMTVSPYQFSCANIGNNTVTLTVTDINGNVSYKTAVVTVQDKLGPVTTTTLSTITSQCSVNILLAYNWGWWYGDYDDDTYGYYLMNIPTAMDNCSGLIYGTTTDPLNYYTQGTYTIHWKFTDKNGNTTIQEQTVIVKDNIAPIPWLTTLPTISGQCSVTLGGYDYDWWDDDDDDDYGIAAPWAWDNCAGWIRGTTKDPLSYTAQGTYVINWKFDDGHGNITTQPQTVIVKDVIAPKPVVSNLPTITGQCSVTVTTVPTANDNCVGIVTATTSSPLTYTAQGTYNIVWKYTDGHGNSSTQNQTVIVKDNIAPVPQVSVLPTITGECSATVTVVPKANDNCSGIITATTTDALTYSKEGTYTIHWKYTDANGNISTQNQIVVINDVTAPVPQVAVLPTITAECSATVTAPKATDNCAGVITGTTSDAVTYNKQGTYTIRWSYNDGNGNTSTQNQTVIIKDVTAPIVSVPANATINCGTSANPSATGTASATDNCSGNISITYSDITTGNTISRTWKATDAAGNYSTGVQTISSVDNTNPVIADVKDVIISCGTSTDPSVTGTPKATDNCSTPTVSYSDVTSDNIITRTWKAKDASGNSSSSIQIITIVDNTKPVISDLPDITINCGASTDPSVTGTPTASDGCSAVTLTKTDVPSGNTIIRTWKAMDASGNYATSTQVITIGSPFSTSITSVPTNNTYTGGVSTNLYIGYGAQSTTLTLGSLPSSGAPYTYAWSGIGLSSNTAATPVFTPSTGGSFTFTVTVTNKYGCTAGASISICVNNIVVPGSNGTKVYVCHTPKTKNAASQTLEVLISQVATHLNNGCGGNGSDRLGSCDQTPCAPVVSMSNTSIITSVTQKAEAIIATTEEELKVTVMPNPSTTYFTLKLESRYETPISMRVMDASGRVMDAKSKIGANSTIQIGHNYSSGTYYAELIQGTKRKVVQLIKAKG